MPQNGSMPAPGTVLEPVDSPGQRKARGAFFTPDPISQYIANWAIHYSSDRVLEPSAGEAAFLTKAVSRLTSLGATHPAVSGVEIHPKSAETARQTVEAAGGECQMLVADFFTIEPEASFDAVIGNPPYIRYQDFSGESRVRSRESALKAGVALTALASSWAAFTVHASLFLREGGRLGLVLPAELLSVNYAAAVRRFLLERFGKVQLVLFEQQVFPDAEADVVLLLAEGFGNGPTSHAEVHQARDADSLTSLGDPLIWTPPDPAGKWTGLLVGTEAVEPLHSLMQRGHFSHLSDWGDTTLGMVTGNNGYFTLSPQRAVELELDETDLLRLSPPGSSHLRGLRLSRESLKKLGDEGRSTWLFYPRGELTDPARRYVEAGYVAGVHQAYKCRVRKPWYKVPLVKPADLLLTCMNADTPRLTTNDARVRHLNSVHGVYLKAGLRALGRDLLPLASLNSVTLLNAEMVGRSYGGGILKIEPREADVWTVPSYKLISRRQNQLREIKSQVARLLRAGHLARSVELVDRALFGRLVEKADLTSVRIAHRSMTERRMKRGRSGR